jgi:hypothetical protein
MKKQKKTGRVKSRVVWSVEIDTGGMGGGEGFEVREREGRYRVTGTDTYSGWAYRSLREALEEHCLNRLPGSGVFMEITSKVLSSLEVAALMEAGDADYETGIRINGEEWVWAEPGVLRLAQDDEERDRSLATL